MDKKIAMRKKLSTLKHLHTKTVMALLIVSLLIFPITVSTVDAIPGRLWVSSASSGVWESSPKTPLGDVEVQIDVVPKVLNLASEGVYTVFLTFPEGYDYGKDVGDIGGETIIMRFNTQDLDVKDFESGDDVILVVQGMLIDGTSFGGSNQGQLLEARATVGVEGSYTIKFSSKDY